jgi:arylsulfatase
VIDVLPTILEVVGISEPAMVNGVPQRDIEGVSMAYSFAKENAAAPSRRYTQYFEMLGNRALYSDGWIACCRHGRLPWVNFGSASFKDDRWELYNIAEDFSESANLADKHPDKLRELQDLFMAEAAKYNVLPLDDRFAERLDVTLRPSWFYGRKQVTFYPGMVRLPEGSGPKTNCVNHTLTVGAEIPKEGAEGVLFCVGGDAGGWSLYMLDGKLVYHYNFFNLKRYNFVSDAPVPSGKAEFRIEFVCETARPGGPANVTMFVNGRQSAAGRIEEQVRSRFGIESMDVGVDKCSPVSDAYRSKPGGFPFTGTIEHVTFDFDGVGHQPTGQERLEMAVKMD